MSGCTIPQWVRSKPDKQSREITAVTTMLKSNGRVTSAIRQPVGLIVSLSRKDLKPFASTLFDTDPGSKAVPLSLLNYSRF